METTTDWTTVTEITAHFQALSSFVPLRPIRDAAGYEAAVASLNRLLDAGARQASNIRWRIWLTPSAR
jgi:HTH-type transcriptional regulator / antitoxin HigA